MYLRCPSRKKNGKRYRYWSVVESRRVAGAGRRGARGRTGGGVVQGQVLYLGEINDSQQAAWRKTISVFDERKRQFEQWSLFPSDRPIPPDEANALSVMLSELRIVRPRSFGDCWLGSLLWEELELSSFWNERLGRERGAVTLRMKLRSAAPGLTPREVLASLTAIQMVDVHIPTTDGRVLILPRYTEPQAEQAMLLEKLKLTLPAQPPPRIRAGEPPPPEISETEM